MQLDRAHLAIRQRQYLDILDLALVVIRNHWLGLGLCTLLGVLPAFAFNAFVVANADPDGIPVLYFTLVFLEAPFATAPITLFLGQITFQSRVSTLRLLSDFFRSLGQLLAFQFVVRCALLVLFVIPTVLVPLRRKFLNEIILLERNPWRRTRKRLAVFHNVHQDRVISSAFANLIFGYALFFILSSGMSTIAEMLRYHQDREWTFEEFESGSGSEDFLSGLFPTYEWEAQVALWLTLAFLTISRFLLYLDCRMRVEGWDVELKLRAAAERIKQDVW